MTWHGRLVVGSILAPCALQYIYSYYDAVWGWEVLLSHAFILQQKQINKFSGTVLDFLFLWLGPLLFHTQVLNDNRNWGASSW